MTKIRQAEPLLPRKFQPAIPEPLEAVTLKLLAKRPDDRYPSAAAFLKELDGIRKLTEIDL